MFTTPFAFMAEAGGAPPPPPPPPENLLLYLDAADPASYSGSGDTWFDLSGNDKNADLYGSPAFYASGRTSYFEFNGHGGGGGEDYAEILGFGMPNGASMEMMLFQDDTSGGIVDRIWSTHNDSFEFGVHTTTSDVSIFAANAWNFNVSSFGGLNICRQFIITADGTTLKLYRDGILVFTTTMGGTITTGTSSYIAKRWLLIEGCVIGVKYIKVHDEVLSAGQVAAAYALNSDRC